MDESNTKKGKINPYCNYVVRDNSISIRIFAIVKSKHQLDITRRCIVEYQINQHILLIL